MKLRNIITLLFLCLATSAMAKDNVIVVKTAREFIEAIGSDRTIVINSKTPLNITAALDEMIEEKRISEGCSYYNLSPEDCYVSDPIPGALEHVTYAPNSDGNGLQIRDVSCLTIKAKKGKATLLATPRYVNVLEFIDSEVITLENLILGHTEEGYCDKGVIEFDGCRYVTMNDSQFFGCGTEGFVFDACAGITVNRCEVYDCSYHTMHVRNSYYVRFNDCNFHNNREFEQVSILGSDYVQFTHCVFDKLQGTLFNLDSYQNFYGCVFHDCEIEPVISHLDAKDYAILWYSTTAYGGTTPACPKEKPQFRLGRYTDGSKTYLATKMDDYSILLSDDESNQGFALLCIDAAANEYTTDFAMECENEYGRLGARLMDKGGQSFIVLLDDGGEPIKNFVFLGK